MKGLLIEYGGVFMAMNGGSLSNQEREELPSVYPEGCDYHWDGQGNPLLASLLLFREHKTVEKTCVGCRRRQCPIRKAPNPNLGE